MQTNKERETATTTAWNATKPSDFASLHTHTYRQRGQHSIIIYSLAKSKEFSL